MHKQINAVFVLYLVKLWISEGQTPPNHELRTLAKTFEILRSVLPVLLSFFNLYKIDLYEYIRKTYEYKSINYYFKFCKVYTIMENLTDISYQITAK